MAAIIWSVFLIFRLGRISARRFSGADPKRVHIQDRRRHFCFIARAFNAAGSTGSGASIAGMALIARRRARDVAGHVYIGQAFFPHAEMRR